MFEYTSAYIQAQLNALPALFRAWFAWLGLVILILPFAFVRHRQGRILMVQPAWHRSAELVPHTVSPSGEPPLNIQVRAADPA